MTETQARQKVVGIMQGWVGLKRSDRSHAPIIDAYNKHTPRPRGYKVSYTDAYCATTTSAAAIKAGFTDIIPVECSCYYLIEKAKAMGIWQEKRRPRPEAGGRSSLRLGRRRKLRRHRQPWSAGTRRHG